MKSKVSLSVLLALLFIPSVMGMSVTLHDSSTDPDLYYFWDSGAWLPYILVNESGPSTGRQYELAFRYDQDVLSYEIHDDPVGVRVYENGEMVVSSSWWFPQYWTTQGGGRWNDYAIVSTDLDMNEHLEMGSPAINGTARLKGEVTFTRTSDLIPSNQLTEIYKLGYDGTRRTNKATIAFSPDRLSRLAWMITGLGNWDHDEPNYQLMVYQVGSLILNWSDFGDIFDYADVQGSSGKITIYTKSFTDPLIIDPSIAITDYGTFRTINWTYDPTFQSEMRVSVYDASAANVGVYFGNVTFDITETLHSDKSWINDRNSIFSVTGDPELTWVETSDDMFQAYWHAWWNGSAINMSYYVWVTIFNYLPFYWVGERIEIVDYSSNSLDIRHYIRTKGGVYDNDAGDTADNWLQTNNTRQTWENNWENLTMHETLWGYEKNSDPGFGIGEGYVWEYMTGSGEYQEKKKYRDTTPSEGDIGYGLHVRYMANLTPLVLADQFYKTNLIDYTLNATGEGITGEFLGINYTRAALGVSADTRVAIWNCTGIDIRYDPIFMITGLAGNSTQYDFQINGVTQTPGTDYFYHFNASTGIMYVWMNDLTDLYDSEVMFEISEGGGPNTDPSVDSPADIYYCFGETGNEINWTVTDPEEATGNYTVFQNGTIVDNDVWTDSVIITIDVDGLDPASYNYTITATDGQGGANATDTVWVFVNSAPVLNHPADFIYVEGEVGNEIVWVVTDGEQGTGNYTIFKDTVLDENGNWINGSDITYEVDGLGPASYNFTITVTDNRTTCGNTTDTVNVTVIANTCPSINTPADIEYSEGSEGNEIDWVVTDTTHPNGPYTIWRNGTVIEVSTWTTTVELNHDIDGLAIASYNFTISGNDGLCANFTDTVMVNVTAVGFWWASTDTFVSTIAFTAFIIITLVVVGGFVIGRVL